MDEFFIYLKDITVSPGYLKEWRIFKMTAVALGLSLYALILNANLKHFFLRELMNRDVVIVSV